MSTIAIPEKFTADLQALALQDARSVEAVIDEAICRYLAERLQEPRLTPVQIERLHEGIAQADRGELVSEQEVEAFFVDWERQASAR